MKLRKPDYYDRFKCIGSACQDTCCAGWEIEIDEETAERYRHITGDVGARLREVVTETEEETYFQLQEGKRCPFLTSENLCELILKLGDGALCDICREHPRHYQWFGAYTEVGLGLCCEEAGRLLFQNHAKLTFVLEEEGGGESEACEERSKPEEETPDAADEQAYIEWFLEARETAYAIAQNREIRLTERLILLLQYAEELQEALDMEDREAGDAAIAIYRNPAAMVSAWRQLHVIQSGCRQTEEPTDRRTEQTAGDPVAIAWFQELLTVYGQLESLDDTWPERMRELARTLPERRKNGRTYLLGYPAAAIEYEQLSVYLLYRYFMEALFDGDILGKIKFLIMSVLIVYALDEAQAAEAGDYTLWTRIQTTKQYSKEIEYCPENMEALGKLCWETPCMSSEALTAMLGAMKTSHTILFDMDGTLLDTERLYRRCWRQAAEECGYRLTEEEILSLRSLGRPFAEERICRLCGSETAYREIRTRRQELMNQILAAEGIPKKPCVDETLAELKIRGCRLAVVTATDAERTERYLAETGLRGYFDRVICATEVEQGKPAPDVYLYACRELGVEPETVWAVEDSPNGVRAAYEAGCRVVMIPDQTQSEPELEPLLTLKAAELKELPVYLL